MKYVRLTFIHLWVSLLIIAANSLAFAAESWVADSATGATIGWVAEGHTLSAASWSGPVVNGKAEGKGTLALTFRDKENSYVRCQGEVEMVAGLLDGKGMLKWESSASYDGHFKAGLREGQGTYTWKNGAVFTGTFKNDTANGYGLLKDPEGKVVYEGEWKDGKEVAPPLKTDKVLGIPWGASEDEAAHIMSQRPNTRCQPFVKNGLVKTKGCYTTFNDKNVFAQLGFYQGKMYYIWILSYTGVDEVMETFNSLKQGMTVRYGAPALEKGKYLDIRALKNP